MIIEIERERECVCVVAHQAILRALYGYFTKCPLKVRPALQWAIAAGMPGNCWVHDGMRIMRCWGPEDR